MTDQLREKYARIIADNIGPAYDNVHQNKRDWIKSSGMFDGEHRDVNGPFRDDYDAAADAILTAIAEEGVGEDQAENRQSIAREMFNAGYSYGIEAEASPEEYDAAWELYCNSGRAADDVRSALTGRGGWRPMSEAPLDGECILLAWKDKNRMPVAVVGQYDKHFESWLVFKNHGYESNYFEAWKSLDFTGLPLPAPPHTEGGDG